jgi:uncharacterized membrane protein
MSALVSLVKGFPGKPSHAPLTDVSVGAYTVGVAMLVAGAFGFEEQAMATGALLAISGGLIVAVPTSLTGLLDWADLGKGTAKRKIANFHLMVMLTATAVFAATWLAQRPGYDDGEVTTLGLVLGLAAFGLLILGGTLGGALAYVYGVRVVKRDVSVADALIPGRLDEGSSARPAQPAAARSGRDAQFVPVAERPVAGGSGSGAGEPPRVPGLDYAAIERAKYRL